MRHQDEVEFTEFATVALRKLRRTAYLMCGDWHRAEDAAQDAIMRVYRRWNRLNRNQGLIAYSHKAVVSAVLDQAKRPWRREHTTDVMTEPPPRPEPGGVVDDRLFVIEALGTLAPSQRACVVLRHYADLSTDDTARALGISTGAVKSQTSRGLERLRQQLGSTERTFS